MELFDWSCPKVLGENHVNPVSQPLLIRIEIRFRETLEFGQERLQVHELNIRLCMGSAHFAQSSSAMLSGCGLLFFSFCTVWMWAMWVAGLDYALD